MDEDVISLARSVEVGLIEVQITANMPTLRTIVHHPAPMRATLRVGELTRERVGVLRATQELLREWEEGATFLDVDFAEQKVRLLMQQALANLRRQRGFVAGARLAELLKPLRLTDKDAEYVRVALQASLRTAALAGGVEDAADLVELVRKAADDKLVRKEADSLTDDLEECGVTEMH